MIAGDLLIVEHKTTGDDIDPAAVYWRRLNLDSQVSTYFAGARALGHEPRLVLYDVIRKIKFEPLTATPLEARKYTQPSSRACPECKKKKGEPAPHRFLPVIGDDGPTLAMVQDADHAFVCKDGRVTTDPGGVLYKNQREADETPDEYRERVRADIADNPAKYFQRGELVRLEQEELDAAADAWAVGREIREAQLAQRWPRNDSACFTWGRACDYFDVCTRVVSIDDPTRFRTADREHEELSANPKRSLPVLSSSSIKSYRSCPRKYFYQYEQRRRALESARALRFGTLFHAALEKWWMTADLDAAFAAMRARYAGLEVDWVDAIRAEELMLGYHVRWCGERFEVLAVEQEFEMELVNPATGAASKTWRRSGKMDALARAM